MAAQEQIRCQLLCLSVILPFRLETLFLWVSFCLEFEVIQVSITELVVNMPARFMIDVRDHSVTGQQMKNYRMGWECLSFFWMQV